MRKKAINEHFFDEESKEMWYVLGVSYGRYFPSKKTVNTWKTPHLGLVEIIKRELGSDHKITVEKGTGIYRLKFGNKHIQSKLYERGCITILDKKSRTFPKDIEEQYLNHFVRGFFDAQMTISGVNGPQLITLIYFNRAFLQGLHQNLVQGSIVQERDISKLPLSYSSQSDIKGIKDFIYRDWDYIQEHGLYLPSNKERFKT